VIRKHRRRRHFCKAIEHADQYNLPGRTCHRDWLSQRTCAAHLKDMVNPALVPDFSEML